jgi:hypothetical protein
MRVQNFIPWTLVLALSVGISWVTWQGPRAPLVPSPPPPLARAPTPAERALVDQLARRVLQELQATTARLGRPLAVHELEATGPDGRPYLPSGLPDNPLVGGVAGVAESCRSGTAPNQTLDWYYCPSPLDFSASVGRTSPPP